VQEKREYDFKEDEKDEARQETTGPRRYLFFLSPTNSPQAGCQRISVYFLKPG